MVTVEVSCAMVLISYGLNTDEFQLSQEATGATLPAYSILQLQWHPDSVLKITIHMRDQFARTLAQSANKNNAANTSSNQIPPVALPAAAVPAAEFSMSSFRRQTAQHQKFEESFEIYNFYDKNYIHCSDCSVY